MTDKKINSTKKNKEFSAKELDATLKEVEEEIKKGSKLEPRPNLGRKGKIKLNTNVTGFSKGIDKKLKKVREEIEKDREKPEIDFDRLKIRFNV